MPQDSSVLVIIIVLVLLCLMWKPAKAYGGCPVGCRCPYCLRRSGFLGGSHDQAVEGAENKKSDRETAGELAKDEDTEAEAAMHDPSEFYESEDQILQKQGAGYNHQDAIPSMALESDVQSSHDAYVKELRGRTTTASKSTVLDSFNPPNKFWGLSMRRGFRQMGAESGARTVPTETPAQALEFASFSHAPFCI